MEPQRFDVSADESVPQVIRSRRSQIVIAEGQPGDRLRRITVLFRVIR